MAREIYSIATMRPVGRNHWKNDLWFLRENEIELPPYPLAEGRAALGREHKRLIREWRASITQLADALFDAIVAREEIEDARWDAYVRKAPLCLDGHKLEMIRRRGARNYRKPGPKTKGH